MPRRTSLAHPLLCVAAMIAQLFNSPNYQATRQLLDAANLRHEALSANIANVETPGYKRVDLAKDFSKDFAAHLRAGNPAGAPRAELAEDTFARTVRKDGNNVDLDKELLALAKNSVEYDMLAEFASGSIKQLRLAITGRPQS